MAKRNVETTKEADEAITRGTGNVFADLGYADAEERQTKLRLAHALNGVIARRCLNQAAAAEKLGINQPKVSALTNYKLDGFSVERLMTFLTALDQDVEIVIKDKPRSRAAGRISVVNRSTAGEPPKKGGILAALRRSPLVGADLNLSRSRE
jgi:predicted XRE-type DNA-binding protein